MTMRLLWLLHLSLVVQVTQAFFNSGTPYPLTGGLSPFLSNLFSTVGYGGPQPRASVLPSFPRWQPFPQPIPYRIRPFPSFPVPTLGYGLPPPGYAAGLHAGYGGGPESGVGAGLGAGEGATAPGAGFGAGYGAGGSGSAINLSPLWSSLYGMPYIDSSEQQFPFLYGPSAFDYDGGDVPSMLGSIFGRGSFGFIPRRYTRSISEQSDATNNQSVSGKEDDTKEEESNGSGIRAFGNEDDDQNLRRLHRSADPSAWTAKAAASAAAAALLKGDQGVGYPGGRGVIRPDFDAAGSGLPPPYVGLDGSSLVELKPLGGNIMNTPGDKHIHHYAGLSSILPVFYMGLGQEYPLDFPHLDIEGILGTDPTGPGRPAIEDYPFTMEGGAPKFSPTDFAPNQMGSYGQEPAPVWAPRLRVVPQYMPPGEPNYDYYGAYGDYGYDDYYDLQPPPSQSSPSRSTMPKRPPQRSASGSLKPKRPTHRSGSRSLVSKRRPKPTPAPDAASEAEAKALDSGMRTAIDDMKTRELLSDGTGGEVADDSSIVGDLSEGYMQDGYDVVIHRHSSEPYITYHYPFYSPLVSAHTIGGITYTGFKKPTMKKLKSSRRHLKKSRHQG